MGLALVAVEAGQAEPAVRLLAAAETLRESHGLAYDQVMRAEDVEGAAMAARACLGEARFTVAWAAGRALPVEMAIAEAMALELTDLSSAVAAPNPATALGLTRREADVVHLLVEGRSNPEIAAVLFVSARTVEWHVTNVLRKLGLRSRAALAAHAARHGLA